MNGDFLFLLREGLYWTVWTATVLFGLAGFAWMVFMAALFTYCTLARSVAWCRKVLRIDVQTLDEETR